MRAIEQRNLALAKQIAQLRHRPLVSVELGAVALLELRPSFGIMPEPFAQLAARSDVLQPQRQRGVLLGDAARPDPVHQHTLAVGLLGRLVDALHRYVEGHYASLG